MQRRMERLARWFARVAMAGMMVSCATVDAAAQNAVEVRSLDAVIAHSMQGSQLDVWGGGPPSPGRTTTIFVHRGDRAAQLYWRTDGWCLARVFRWTIEDARSATDFRVRYVALRQDTDCIMDTGAVEELHVVGVGGDADRPVLTAVWERGDVSTVRTRCSTRVDDPAPCGFSEAFALVPPM